MEMYSKMEPSGEYGLGKLSEDDIKELNTLMNKNARMADSEFCQMPMNYANIINVYGIATDINGSEFTEQDILTKISIESLYNIQSSFNGELEELEDGGFYICYSSPTKISMGLSLEEEINNNKDIEDKNIDLNKLKINYTEINFNPFYEDMYGEVDLNIISSIEYDGIELDYIESLVDRGFSTEVKIFQIINGEEKTIFECSNTMDEGTFIWG